MLTSGYVSETKHTSLLIKLALIPHQLPKSCAIISPEKTDGILRVSRTEYS